MTILGHLNGLFQLNYYCLQMVYLFFMFDLGWGGEIVNSVNILMSRIRLFFPSSHLFQYLTHDSARKGSLKQKDPLEISTE